MSAVQCGAQHPSSSIQCDRREGHGGEHKGTAYGPGSAAFADLRWTS